MNYKELQTNFEKEVRQEIKKINKEFAVNIHTYPEIYVELHTPSTNFTDQEQNKVQQYAEQIDKCYRIINDFMDKLQNK